PDRLVVGSLRLQRRGLLREERPRYLHDQHHQRRRRRRRRLHDPVRRQPRRRPQRLANLSRLELRRTPLPPPPTGHRRHLDAPRSSSSRVAQSPTSTSAKGRALLCLGYAADWLALELVADVGALPAPIA